MKRAIIVGAILLVLSLGGSGIAWAAGLLPSGARSAGAIPETGLEPVANDALAMTGEFLSPAKPVEVADISRPAADLPGPITRSTSERVVVELEAKQVVAALADGTTYEYWTYNGQVPGPFVRVREGDTVEVRLKHVERPEVASHDTLSHTLGQVQPAEEDHDAAGHGEHSIDLHAVTGPGGGADLARVGPDETKAFQFKATRPGIYVYHCGSPHVPTHIANGMYGLILVEPAGGLPPVDKEYYVMQGELYTAAAVGQKGHQQFSLDKLLAEQPEYYLLNGRVGALTQEQGQPLTANTGETVRIFFGVPNQNPANFHVIGGIFDRLYAEGDLLSPPHRNIETALMPAGGAAMVELKLEVPGKYRLVDHTLTRSTNRGGIGDLLVSGPERPDLFAAVPIS